MRAGLLPFCVRMMQLRPILDDRAGGIRCLHVIKCGVYLLQSDYPRDQLVKLQVTGAVVLDQPWDVPSNV